MRLEVYREGKKKVSEFVFNLSESYLYLPQIFSGKCRTLSYR